MTMRDALMEARSGLVAYNGGPDGACAETIARIDAALSTPKPVSVPEGWRLVPIEPTDKMMLMGGFRFAGKVPNSEVFKEVRKGWDDMLDAAPPPPVSADPVSGEETSGELRAMGYAPIDPDTGVSSVPDAMYTLQCTITATKGTAADAYRRRAFKSLEKSISALSPEGVNAVARESDKLAGSAEALLRYINPNNEAEDIGRQWHALRDQIARYRAASIPDTSKEGGKS